MHHTQDLPEDLAVFPEARRQNRAGEGQDDAENSAGAVLGGEENREPKPSVTWVPRANRRPRQHSLILSVNNHY